MFYLVAAEDYAVVYGDWVEPVSRLRCNDGSTDVQLIETADTLHLSTITNGVETPVAAYGCGQIRTVMDRHSARMCTLRVHADDGAQHEFRCPSEVCAVLLVKLRKFQGPNPEASLPEGALLAGDPALAAKLGSRSAD